MSLFGKLMSLFGGAPENGEGDRAMISCEDALNAVHEYLDGELDDASEEDVKAHFDMCEACYPHLRLEEAFKDAVQRASRGERAPPELRTKVLELLADAE